MKSQHQIPESWDYIPAYPSDRYRLNQYENDSELIHVSDGGCLGDGMGLTV